MVNSCNDPSLRSKGRKRNARWLEALGLLIGTVTMTVLLCSPLWTARTGAESASLQGGPADLEMVPPPWILPLDDAYILIRYAQQLALGRPFEWTDGEISSGSTSIIYPLFLLPGQWIGHDIAAWSIWSSLVGALTVWWMGLAAVRVLGAVGLPRMWSFLGGLMIIWTGPVVWVSVSGMDSALACASVLLACALWVELDQVDSGPVSYLAVLLAVLPLIRADLVVITLLGAAGIVLGRVPPLKRWTGGLLLLPVTVLSAFYLIFTGHALPAGAVAKSSFGFPYLSLPGYFKEYFFQVSKVLFPVYSGQSAELLPSWVILSAFGTIVGVLLVHILGGERDGPNSRRQDQRNILRRSLPLVVCWGALLLISPLSFYLSWQFLRHHHPALICMWLMATIGLYLLTEVGLDALAARFGGKSRKRWRRIVYTALGLGIGGALLVRAPVWAGKYLAQASSFHQANGLVAKHLAGESGGGPLLVHDAGLLAVRYSGPMIDMMGLGSADFALPIRHELGSVIETLARKKILPKLAAVRTAIFAIPELLESPILEVDNSNPKNTMVIAEVKRDLLRSAALPGPGVDFGDLESERQAQLEWSVPPWPHHASFAIALYGSGNRLEVEGCRPLRQSLTLQLRGTPRAVRLKATAQSGHSGVIEIYQRHPIKRLLATISLPIGATAWTVATIGLPATTTHLELLSTGSGAPCIESIAFLQERIEGSDR